MKYLKIYEEFDYSDELIHEICKKYAIENYVINNGLVDVNGDVFLIERGLSDLPLRFGKVSGNFDISENNITSLEGCPEEVGGNFECSENKLTSLEGSPKEIGGGFNCSENRLTSLNGCPIEVGASFYCGDNNLTTLEGAPSIINGNFDCRNNNLTTLEGGPIKVKNVLNCAYNDIISLNGIPLNLSTFICDGNPISNIWKLFKDLDKLEYFIDCDMIREPEQESRFDKNGRHVLFLPIVILQRLNHFLEEIGKKTVTKVEKYKCI